MLTQCPAWLLQHAVVHQEEVRARQSRYKYDASAVKERLSKLEAALNANSVLAGAGGVGI